jgi:hypothetical protein
MEPTMEDMIVNVIAEGGRPCKKPNTMYITAQVFAYDHYCKGMEFLS